MLATWQGDQSPSMESARLRVSEGRLHVSGRLIETLFSASYDASVHEATSAVRLLLRTTTAEDDRQIALSRTEDGVWLVDGGDGAQRDEFDGALDIDVAGAVAFNTFPVRRLALHREVGAHELAVVYVSLPDLSVRQVRQTYRTVSVGADTAVVTFTQDDFTADVTVDSDGVVLEYPGLARRVPPMLPVR